MFSYQIVLSVSEKGIAGAQGWATNGYKHAQS